MSAPGGIEKDQRPPHICVAWRARIFEVGSATFQRGQRGDDPPSARRRVMRGIQSAASSAGNAVYLGQGRGGWAWAGPERPTLVLGPSRAGKTSSIVVPNVLAASGAVVSTSTKPDVMTTTAGARSLVGSTLLYDPTGNVETLSGVTRVGWSPVNAAGDWDAALATADAMVRSSHHGMMSGDHWSERATALLAPLLHAAALEGTTMATVLGWVDRHQGEEALSALVQHCGAEHPSTAVLSGILTTDYREQSGIWSTASGVLAAYRSTAALCSTMPPFLDAEAFCGATNTLYICTPGRQQQLLAPLVVGLLSELRDAAYRRAREGESHPPVLFALDEVANIAPLPDLPSIVTEGAGQGLLTLACLQDLSQARHRWGREADAFLSIFGCTVVFGGIGDMATLEALSVLGGEVEVATHSYGRSRGYDGRAHPSVNVSSIFRRRLPVDVVARGLPGRALCLDAGNRLGFVELTPAYAARPWNEVADTSRRQRARETEGRHR
jgi:type IV secretion system protein VirD4